MPSTAIETRLAIAKFRWERKTEASQQETNPHSQIRSVKNEKIGMANRPRSMGLVSTFHLGCFESEIGAGIIGNAALVFLLFCCYCCCCCCCCVVCSGDIGSLRLDRFRIRLHLFRRRIGRIGSSRDRDKDPKKKHNRGRNQTLPTPSRYK